MAENKHTAYDLVQMQSLPLKSKVQMTKRRIREWYEHFDGNVYVSISGGKDSQVLAHIVKGMYPDVPLVFVNTGLEYDSVRLKGTEMADEVIRPDMDFVNVIKKYGYPVISKEVALKVHYCRVQAKANNIDVRQTNLYRRDFVMDSEKSQKYSMYCLARYDWLLDAPFLIDSQCCDVMKKRPAKKYEKRTHNKPIIGTMAEESRVRRTKWIKTGCNAFDGKRAISQPLSFWTEQDIYQYIKQNNLKLADVYGEIVYTDEDGMFYDEPLFNDSMQLQTTGANRTGCVFCMFGITQETDRFLRLKELEPQKYDYVMRGGKFDEEGMWIPDKGLGYKFVIDWLNEHGNLNIKY